MNQIKLTIELYALCVITSPTFRFAVAVVVVANFYNLITEHQMPPLFMVLTYLFVLIGSLTVLAYSLVNLKMLLHLLTVWHDLAAYSIVIYFHRRLKTLKMIILNRSIIKSNDGPQR